MGVRAVSTISAMPNTKTCRCALAAGKHAGAPIPAAANSATGRLSIDSDTSGRQTGQCPQQRAFAGAVATDHAPALPRFDPAN